MCDTFMGESVVACAEDRVMGMIRPCYGEHHGHQAPGPTPSERTTTNPKCVQYLREGRRCCTYRHDAKRLHASPLLLVLRLGRCGGGGQAVEGPNPVATSRCFQTQCFPEHSNYPSAVMQPASSAGKSPCRAQREATAAGPNHASFQKNVSPVLHT